MTDIRDISECQTGDIMVRSNGDIAEVIEHANGIVIAFGQEFDDRQGKLLCGYVGGGSIAVVNSEWYIRPASTDDIARHTKRQLSAYLNKVKWMDKSIEHLTRIKAAVEDCGKEGA